MARYESYTEESPDTREMRGRRSVVSTGPIGPVMTEIDNDNPPTDQAHAKIWDLGSVYIENKGSVARDHLASERTFLAWLRTSLAFATIGVGVTQLFKMSGVGGSDAVVEYAKPLGLLFILTAVLTLVFGVTRYFLIQKLLIEGVFPASRLFIGTLIAIVFVVSILM